LTAIKSNSPVFIQKIFTDVTGTAVYDWWSADPNFPNNPCGYSINLQEAQAVSGVLIDAARKGTRLIVVLDEAYYGLFYADGLLRESLLGYLANQDQHLLIVKLDGTREEFDREKVLRGIRIACAKRPVSAEDIERLVGQIEAELQKLGKAEISSRVVGDLVIKGLKELDQIAYIRYAIVYLRMDDLHSCGMRSIAFWQIN
jgi:transcriptional regulator NrdR